MKNEGKKNSALVLKYTGQRSSRTVNIEKLQININFTTVLLFAQGDM